MKVDNKRNMLRQRIFIKDASGKVIGSKDIFHLKKMPSGNYKNFWDQLNSSPRKTPVKNKL